MTAPSAPVITSPVTGDTVASPLMVSGTTSSDGSVVIYDGSATISTAAAVNGSFSTSVDLIDGPHELWADLTDGNGKSGASALVDVTVASTPAPGPTPTPDPSPVPPPPAPQPPPPVVTAPGAPVIEVPGADEHLIESAVKISGTSDDPGASVSVFNGGKSIAQASVDDAGNWATEVTLINGDYTIVAQAADAGRGTGSQSDPVSFSVEVDPTPTPAPVPTDPDERLAEFFRNRVFKGRDRSWEFVMELQREAEHWLTEKGFDAKVL